MSVVLFEAIENDKATDLFEAEKVGATAGPCSGACVVFISHFPQSKFCFALVMHGISGSGCV